MTSFRNLPIRRKLSVAFLGTTFAALLLACGAFVIYERMTFQKSMVDNLTVLADALGQNCTANLKFDNRDEGEEVLSALSFEPTVIMGCLFNNEGAFFAGYSTPEAGKTFPVAPGDDGHVTEGGYLSLQRPVLLDGKRIGTIYLKATLEGVRDRIMSYIGISGVVLVGALTLSLALSAGLQRLIARPIVSLSEAAGLITERNDYSIRVPPTTGDELGVLTHSFNRMLNEIQERDSQQVKTNAELSVQIEARSEAEGKLKRFNEQLEARVQQRTRELQRSNQELEQFAYVASHDLQEPLRMISSFMQLMERRYKGRLDDDADQYIGYAVDGARRLQLLIQDLLAFSRVGSHGAPLEPTNCEEVLGRVLGNLQVAATESGAQITSDPMPVVLGDASQLVQLFQNLLANGLKFRGKEAPRIHVGARREGDEWTFTVSDNGIGIEKQFFEKIFTIFQRLHGREEYAGTGIGLAVCKKIVERHRGRIWLESELGKGTQFHFTLSSTTATPQTP